jgi:hypothetical protein
MTQITLNSINFALFVKNLQNNRLHTTSPRAFQQYQKCNERLGHKQTKENKHLFEHIDNIDTKKANGDVPFHVSG